MGPSGGLRPLRSTVCRVRCQSRRRGRLPVCALVPTVLVSMALIGEPALGAQLIVECIRTTSPSRSGGKCRSSPRWSSCQTCTTTASTCTRTRCASCRPAPCHHVRLTPKCTLRIDAHAKLACLRCSVRYVQYVSKCAYLHFCKMRHFGGSARFFSV